MAKKEYYTLQDAIEWIVFRKDSKYVTAEMLNMNTNNIALAEIALLNAIKSHKIQLIGQFNPNMLPDISEPEELIDCFHSTINIYPTSNAIFIGNTRGYSNIKIEKKAFQAQFPPTTPPTSPTSKSNTYTTPYLDIIAEVIQEEHISYTNQSKKEVLKDIVLQKMKQRQIPESTKLADAMATIMRQLNSQKGRRKRL